MNDQNEYLTEEKFAELTKELEELKTAKRREVAENLEYAKSLGDLSENAEYHEARERQANIEDRIAKLEAMLKSAVIVSPPHGETVGVGSTVELEKRKDASRKRYKIVGSEESDVAKGKLSIHSPIGAAIMGKRRGESVKAETPGGTVEYRIIIIE